MGFAVAIGWTVEVGAAAMRTVEHVATGTVDDPLVGRHRWGIQVQAANGVDGNLGWHDVSLALGHNGVKLRDVKRLEYANADQGESVMGMDVYGRKPSSEAGKYFRANVWSWRPIHALIYELCSDRLNDETLEGMNYNSGAGPTDQATCTAMAERFEMWMEHNIDGHKVDLGMNVARDGRLLSDEEIEGDPGIQFETPHRVDDDHLKEWIEFLRHCGGFEVR